MEERKAYGAGALAAAAVVCDLDRIAAGPFLTIGAAAGAGELEKGREAHFCCCLRARTAVREGIDRSMVEEWRVAPI